MSERVRACTSDPYAGAVDAPAHVAGRDDRITLRFMTTPADTAAGGRSIAAGSVMEWIDKAGYACAVGWAGTYCVTAYVGNVLHRRPIAPGSLVEVQARLIHTGRTSMHVVATVSAASVRDRVYRAATTCILIFVAKDSDGRPTAVSEWRPSSHSDHALAAAALDRIDKRARIKQLMLAEEYPATGDSPRSTMRFLAPPGAVNWGGKAHGGTVMRWIDEAAYVCAVNWVAELGDAAKDAVAVYSGGIHFFAPVQIGDLVEIETRLIYTSRRSIHLTTRVSTADPRRPLELTLTTQCMSVFVVPGRDGTAVPVPQWMPRAAEDVRLHDHARAVIRLREDIAQIPASLTLEP